MLDKLICSMSEMEDVLSRTANRCDIWQDRCVHAMARAIYLILKWIIRMEEAKK